MKTVLLTGASGFVGQYLVERYTQLGYSVIALSRQERVSKVAGLSWRVADITDESRLLEPGFLDSLGEIDLILHASALYDLNADHHELFKQNVVGTANMVQLARSLKSQPHFAHISTVAIAGNANVNFHEDTFDVGQQFPDPYASTKFAAENIVRNAHDLASRSIYRLGIVVGSTIDGHVDRIDGPYYLQKLVRKLRPVSGSIGPLRFIPFPYNERTRLYLIPVDVAAKVIAELSLKVAQREGISTFHVLGGGRGVSARRALLTMLSFYNIPLNPLAIPKFAVPARVFQFLGTPYNSVEYINAKWTFSSTKLEREMPDFRYPSFTHISGKLMDFAERNLFNEGRDA